MAGRRRFPIRFSSGNSILFRGLLILPSRSYVDLDGHGIRVRLGWAFDARIPRRMAAKAGPGRLNELSVSLEDPEGFLAALGAPPR